MTGRGDGLRKDRMTGKDDALMEDRMTCKDDALREGPYDWYGRRFEGGTV